jgi:hypothetical protein
MSLAEVLPDVQSLSHLGKIRLIQIVAQDLEQDESGVIEAGRPYPVWSPDCAGSAATTMLEVLRQREGLSMNTTSSRCRRSSFFLLAIFVVCSALLSICPTVSCRGEDSTASLEELRAKWETQRSSIKTARLTLRYLLVTACKVSNETAEEAVQKWRAGLSSGQKQESLEMTVLLVLGDECPSKWETLEVRVDGKKLWNKRTIGAGKTATVHSQCAKTEDGEVWFQADNKQADMFGGRMPYKMNAIDDLRLIPFLSDKARVVDPTTTRLVPGTSRIEDGERQFTFDSKSGFATEFRAGSQTRSRQFDLAEFKGGVVFPRARVDVLKSESVIINLIFLQVMSAEFNQLVDNSEFWIDAPRRRHCRRPSTPHAGYHV